jgi:hypothetical protein
MNKLCVAKCIDRVMLHFKEPLIPIGHGRNHTCRSFREAVLLAHHYIICEGFHEIVKIDYKTGVVHVDLSTDAMVIETVLRYG